MSISSVSFFSYCCWYFLRVVRPIVPIILDFIRDDGAIGRVEQRVLRIRLVSDPPVRSAASSKMETK
jgi:hypothetical protein